VVIELVALSRRRAISFVVLIGLVSLFADMTYEGARSIAGLYLASLGATGTVVGIVGGAGELAGYGIRLLSGVAADRTGRYWTFAFVGYVINLCAVPLLALAGNWPLAAALLIAERTGKAIRTPSRDAMLSFATHTTGHGWGFGLHEAMDQTGAMIGPLIVAAVLAWRGDYPMAFSVLAIPAVLALTGLMTARFLFPRPQDLEVATAQIGSDGLGHAYWFYVVAACLAAAAYVDYPLIAFHFAKTGVVSQTWVPVFYAFAMGVEAVSALVFGRWFDRRGAVVLTVAIVVSSVSPILVFTGGFFEGLAGMAAWGIGMGAIDTVMRAFIGSVVAVERRAVAYGTFDACFGLAWFVGSALMGWAYDISPLAVAGISVVGQVSALAVLQIARHKASAARSIS
jgi:MFS family permease